MSKIKQRSQNCKMAFLTAKFNLVYRSVVCNFGFATIYEVTDQLHLYFIYIDSLITTLEVVFLNLNYNYMTYSVPPE